MCAGAMLHARIKRLVFAAYDPNVGAAGSVFDILLSDQFNHKLECEGGVLADECGGLLSSFFRKIREQQRKSLSE